MIPDQAPPLVTNAGSRAQNASARRRVRDRIKTTVGLVRQQLSTYEGRAFVWWRLEEHRIFEHIGGSDATVREQLGIRNAGLKLYAECAAHPEFFHQMHVEGRQRAEVAKREAEAAAAEAAKAEESETE